MTFRVYKSVSETLESLKKEIGSHESERICKTGFKKFDKLYFGIAPREFWVIGGYTNTGKTFFCLQLLINLLSSGKKVLYFSLEMSVESIISRLWGNLSGLDASRIEWGYLTPEEYQSKEAGSDKLRELGKSAYIIDDVYTLKGIEEVISQVKPDVVIIDYLQNLLSSMDEYQKLTSASANIQLIAKKYDVAVIAASQVSNEEAKVGIGSKIIGYKGSGGIAAACDFGLWLDNTSDFETENNQKITLAVRKCRRGPRRKLYMQLVFPSGRFEETTDIVDQAKKIFGVEDTPF